MYDTVLEVQVPMQQRCEAHEKKTTQLSWLLHSFTMNMLNESTLIQASINLYLSIASRDR